MFTGIVEILGSVISIDKNPGGGRLIIEAQFSSQSPKVGDSIAVNGICLTVTKIYKCRYFFDASNTTLNASNLGMLSSGQIVNIERALRFDQRLDGHLVTGHIDTKVKINHIIRAGSSFRIAITVPPEFSAHMVHRGSIALDGISLTIADLKEEQCWVTVIPFTWENTNLKYKKEGEYMNMETDIIGKYIQRQVITSVDLKKDKKVNSLTIEKILQSGF